MRDELTGFCTGRTKAHAVYNVIETTFQQLQQVFTSCTFASGGLFVIVAELLLQNAVDTTNFLFLTKLYAVLGQTTATRAVHTRRSLDVALGIERANTALQKKICPFTTRQLALRAYITSHNSLSPVLDAALLGRTTAVVGNRRHICDVGDLVATRIQRANCRLTSGPRTLNLYVQVFKAVFSSRITGSFSCYLRSKRCTLA
mmetsp:Transcript_18272/g.27564  ORF Transcript_18272/g.27564 Transcript_18272/m.27564 type:complete len:202 (-) Transcript_18272:1009-1614(-)